MEEAAVPVTEQWVLTSRTLVLLSRLVLCLPVISASLLMHFQDSLVRFSQMGRAAVACPDALLNSSVQDTHRAL